MSGFCGCSDAFGVDFVLYHLPVELPLPDAEGYGRVVHVAFMSLKCLNYLLFFKFLHFLDQLHRGTSSGRLCSFGAIVNRGMSIATERGMTTTQKTKQILTGTEKQITWAEDIRTQRMADLMALEQLVAAAPASHPAKVALATIRSHYEAADSAAWWIDHDQTTVAVKSMASLLAQGKAACGDGTW